MTVTAALDQVFCPTKALLQIAQECTHLHKFVYISTGIVHTASCLILHSAHATAIA